MAVMPFKADALNASHIILLLSKKTICHFISSPHNSRMPSDAPFMMCCMCRSPGSFYWFGVDEVYRHSGTDIVYKAGCGIYIKRCADDDEDVGICSLVCRLAYHGHRLTEEHDIWASAATRHRPVYPVPLGSCRLSAFASNADPPCRVRNILSSVRRANG